MKPTAIKAVKRNESLKKTKISQLALDLQADSPVSPKKSRASTNFSNFEKNATINGSLTQRMTTPERKKNLRKSISNSDLQALSEATKQKSLKLHLERRKSRFTYEDIHNAISNVRPPTPSFLADTSMFAVTPRGSNMTAKLHGACAAGRVEQFQELIDKTIEMENFLDLNASHLDMDSNKCTLMHTAAKHGRVPIMHILWNKGASIDVPDSLDATPLV
jgi:ankyrin repeat protein